MIESLLVSGKTANHLSGPQIRGLVQRAAFGSIADALLLLTLGFGLKLSNFTGGKSCLSH